VSRAAVVTGRIIVSSLQTRMSADAASNVKTEGIFTAAALKNVLQEEPDVGTLPKDTVGMIHAASTLLLQDILQQIPKDVITVDDIRSVVTEKYSFLTDSALDSIQEGSTRLLPQQPKKRKAPTAKGTRKKATPAQEAVQVAHLQPATLSSKHSEIVQDEEDYD
jgi:hypothetical protein